MSCDILKLQAYGLARIWGPDVGMSSEMYFQLFPSILNLIGRANGVKMQRNTLTHLMFACRSDLWANTHQPSS
jgi:hypothetical protein